MTKLRLDHAPSASLPRRFLLSAPLWGMLAGALLLLDGDLLAKTRWSPDLLALVHIFTLGVLGNIMFGSVLQFLPVAAAVRVRGGVRLGLGLHGAFNLGVAALVLGLHQGWPVALDIASVLLPLAFITLAAMTLPGLWQATGQRLLRAGFSLAIGFALGTALLGGALVAGLQRGLPWPLPALTDIHASWGIVGWVLVLMASVARVVMPMFQGTGSVSARVQSIWLGSVVLSLLLAAWWRLAFDQPQWLRATVAMHALLLTSAVLWLQRRARRARRGPLLWSWRAGAITLMLAALALALDLRGGRLAGMLALAVALPLLLVGMAQEIIAFIGWIALQRRCGRGLQLPGVQRLMPDRDKTRVLLAQLPPAVLLTAAVAWPSVGLTRAAGLALLLTWALVWWSLDGVRQRSNHFARAVAQQARHLVQ